MDPAEQRPVPPPAMTARRFARWLLVPGLFVGACVAIAVSPVRALRWLPKPRQSWLLSGPVGGGAAVTLLHKLPRSMASAWELGRIAEQLVAVQAVGTSPVGQSAADALLGRAAAILGIPAVRLSPQHLLNLGVTLKEFEARRGIAARLAGALSLVNTIWAFAILGVAVSVGPAIAAVCQPLWDRLAAAAQVVARVTQQVVVALAPLWEPLMYLGCLYFIGAAHRYPNDVGTYISATGCLLSFPAFIYSCYRHLIGTGHNDAFQAITHLYMAGVFAPAAVAHSSQLLGFLASAAFYGAVGFSVIPTGLCWHIGFDSNSSMVRAATTAAVMLGTLVGLRAAGVGDNVRSPFRLGLSVFGAITLHLAGLCMSSTYYPGNHTYSSVSEEKRAARRRYISRNLKYLGLLASSMGLGTSMNLPGLSNTAITFAVLWVGEKSCEHVGTWSTWMAVFVGSLGLWQAALALRSHPDWLTSLVSAW